ncbi:MAG: hypothetical protein IKS48_12455 [Eubacterium sp.]|nr:hypothetical protein [Eubacterium sp.]
MKLGFLCGLFTILVVVGTGYIVKNCISDKKAFRNQGIEAFNAGRYDEAVELFNASMDEQQWFTQAMDADTDLYLAATYIRSGRYKDASNIYIKYVGSGVPGSSISEADIDSFQNLAKALEETKSGNFKETTLPGLQAEYDRGNMSIALYLGAYYQKNADYENMIKCFEDYSNKFGMNTYIAMQLSSYYIEKGDMDSAMIVINQGLSAKDDIFKDRVMFNSVVLAEQNLDYDAALEKAAELIEAYPNNETYQKEYDFLYSRINKNTEPVHKEKDKDKEEDSEDKEETEEEENDQD